MTVSFEEKVKKLEDSINKHTYIGLLEIRKVSYMKSWSVYKLYGEKEFVSNLNDLTALKSLDDWKEKRDRHVAHIMQKRQ